nr:sulfotransferase [Bdellovibrio sp. HAGR004]
MIDKMISPIFILGNPRSGTTLLRLLLTSHRDVVVPPEAGFLVWLSNKYGDWNSFDSNSSSAVLSYVNDLFGTKKFETWGLNKSDVITQIAKNKPSSYSELSSCIYHSYAKKIAKEVLYWGDKNNFYLNHIEELNRLYPGAKYIHIVRDGRDVACSYLDMGRRTYKSQYAPQLPQKIEEIASQWRNNVLKIERDLKKCSSVFLTIRYEDLVNKTDEELHNICDFLGIEFQNEMASFYLANRSQKLEPVETLEWKQKTLMPIERSSVGRYLDILSKEDVLRFEEVARDALDIFQYKNCPPIA